MKTVPFKKTYPDGFVLSVAELEWAPGEICCVLGSNGCGKTTLGRCLASVLKTDEEVPPWTESFPVGYLPQKPYSFRMSTENNILLAERNRERATHLMELLGIGSLSRQRGDRLSGGECARMCLARVLMRSCRFLILDEPSASMDIAAIQLTEQVVKEYRDETGAAVLFITHDIRQAERIADRVMFLDGGRVAEHSGAGEFFQSPRTDEAKRFLEFYGSRK